jgi:hypothetical protein
MALLESERNLAEAQRIARLGNWVLEWPTRQMKWSEETFRISGLEPAREAPDFETYVQTLLPEDRPVLEKALRESVRLGKPFNLEVRHAAPGGLNYIAVKGQPVSRDGQVVRSVRHLAGHHGAQARGAGPAGPDRRLAHGAAAGRRADRLSQRGRPLPARGGAGPAAPGPGAVRHHDPAGGRHGRHLRHRHGWDRPPPSMRTAFRSTMSGGSACG